MTSYVLGTISRAEMVVTGVLIPRIMIVQSFFILPRSILEPELMYKLADRPAAPGLSTLVPLPLPLSHRGLHGEDVPDEGCAEPSGWGQRLHPAAAAD